MYDKEVDVWNGDKGEFEPAKVIDRNGSLKCVEFDDGRVDWVADFETEDRSY